MPNEPCGNDTCIDRQELVDLRARIDHLTNAIQGACHVRPEVLWFAKEMERQLRGHDRAKGKQGWKGMSFDELFVLLDGEMKELGIEFADDRDGSLRGMIHEAADLANIAMMIADNARRRETP